MQTFRQIGLTLWIIGAIQNRYPIVVFDVMNDREPNNTFIKSKSLAFDKKVCLQIRSRNFVD